MCFVYAYNVYSNAQSLKGVFNVIASIVCVCLCMCMLVLLKEARNNRPFSINTIGTPISFFPSCFFWTKNRTTRVLQNVFLFFKKKRILPFESFNVLFFLLRDEIVCVCVCDFLLLLLANGQTSLGLGYRSLDSLIMNCYTIQSRLPS